MRIILGLFISFNAISITACKKDNISLADCMPNSATVRQITNKQATVILQNEQYYLIEQGTIDTRLAPCNLPKEFQVNNLQVTISGDVKSTIRNGVEPCCTENFVITKISN